MSLLDGIDRPTSGGSDTDDLARQLRRSLDAARPHQLGLAGCGGLVGVLLLFLVVALVGLAVAEGGSSQAVGTALGGGACYGSLALVYLLPAYFLFRTAQALVHPGTTRDQVLLATERLRRFWQVAAAVVLAVVGLYVAMFALIAVLAAIGASLESTFEEIATEVDAGGP